MKVLQQGDIAPDFSLPASNGETVSLKDFASKKVVLFFYPKDNTPGCTKEACDFQAHMPTFKRAKAAVLGISILNEASKQKFANKHKLTFPLLADEDHAISEKYGVWQKKNRYGHTYMGIVRTTYLIGKNGKVIKRWDKVKVDDHVTEVSETLALARKH